MSPDRFLWIGPGSLAVDHATFPALALLRLETHPARDTAIYFAALSRLPRNVISPERLAYFLSTGQASETDAGYPGPQRSHVAGCFTHSLMNHAEVDQERFKDALRTLYTAARAGHREGGF